MSYATHSAVPVTLADDLGGLALENGDDSMEVQIPDFHYDWGVIKEKEYKPTIAERVARSDKVNTPSPRHSVSVQSSASSSHLMGLTDASTASASSLVPTPPAPNARDEYSASTALSSRRFQRVVSAPVARRSPPEMVDQSGDESRATTSTYAHTATIRPPLTHTSSTGHVVGRVPITTPGMTDRLTSSMASTGRRVGGLSRFGGPARRVVASSDDTEHESATPPLMSSPPTEPPISQTSAERKDQSPAGQMQPYAARRRTPDLSPQGYSRDQTAEAGPSRPTRMPSPPPEAKPFRPFDTNQSERPGRNQHASVSVARPVPAVHSYSRSADVDGRARTEVEIKPLRPVPEEFHYAASRAAPVPAPPPIAHTQTMPAAPAAPAAGKRSFIVNGVAYERIGTLGKGGSSKVYSVLSHSARSLFALKRVALDRADFETYQSYTNEIELLKRLNGHDRIIKLVDHQITFGPGNRPKILMMVLECGEIDFALLLDEQRGQPLNMNFVGLYWEQMLEAVHAVHQENVVHTDLKPANFVLVKGRLKIIDFGIAKAVANDTVNIQRDQQIGTVNYMSPEAIQRMNNQKVLKLSYPSDVWSLGCILYQMIYGSPPFQHIAGGPLPKMTTIADPSHRIDYPTQAIPRPVTGFRTEDMEAYAVTVPPSAIDAMRRCLMYRKEHRLTIPELLVHEFLRPKINSSSLPSGSTSITQSQMAMLVNFILREHELPTLKDGDTTAQDLFGQLQAQNALTQ